MTANPDGSDFQVYASGLRNAVGLTFNPVSGALWAAVNERDELGDKLPPDYVTSVKSGGFYGWPYYYIGPNHDPRMPDRPDLIGKVIVPDVLLEAHCAALSIEFYTGHQFPKQYYHDGFVVMHGSWNRSDPSGYKVVRLEMNRDGTTKNHGYQDFIWGWKPDVGNVWGRPVSIGFLPDGSMLVSDDGAGKIWRVTYTGN
jgi:glucose/arabinose dehydrogenase